MKGMEIHVFLWRVVWLTGWQAVARCLQILGTGTKWLIETDEFFIHRMGIFSQPSTFCLGARLGLYLHCSKC